MRPASAAHGEAGSTVAFASWPTTPGHLLLTVWWLWPLPVRMADHLIEPVGRPPFIAADVHRSRMSGSRSARRSRAAGPRAPAKCS